MEPTFGNPTDGTAYEVMQPVKAEAIDTQSLVQHHETYGEAFWSGRSHSMIAVWQCPAEV